MVKTIVEWESLRVREVTEVAFVAHSETSYTKRKTPPLDKIKTTALTNSEELMSAVVLRS